MNLGAWIFFGVLAIGLIMGVKRKRITILDMSLFIVITLVIYLIDYLFDSDILGPFIVTEDSLTISFVGIILLMGTFLLIKLIINKFKLKKSESQE